MRNIEISDLVHYRNEIFDKLNSRIIDFHTHIAFYKFYSPAFVCGMLPELATYKATSLKASKKEELIQLFMNDSDCDKLVKQMEVAGIKKAILLLIDTEYGLGKVPWQLEEIYQKANSIAKKHPEKFYIFAGIDPRRGKRDFEFFRQGVIKKQINGVKLYPPFGFSALDENLMPYYRICEEYHIPVVIHTGFSLSILKNQFDNPLEMGGLVARFPGVKFILAHAGYRIDEYYYELARKFDNTYLDIAGFQTSYKVIDEYAVKYLGCIFEPSVNRKVLFGSDWPLFNIFNPLKTNINFIIDLFIQCEDAGCNIEKLENVFFRNANSIFGMEDSDE